MYPDIAPLIHANVLLSLNPSCEWRRTYLLSVHVRDMDLLLREKIDE